MSNLFLDPKPIKIAQAPGLKDVIKKVTQHELGHYIAARVHGFKVGDIKLKLTDHLGAHDASATIELIQSINNLIDVQNYLEQRIIILYSGVLAENIENKNVYEEKAKKALEEGGANDFAKIRELIRLLRNIKYPLPDNDVTHKQQLDDISNYLWKQAKELVLKESELIIGIAENLADKVELTHTEYTLTENDLDLIPNLSKRFNKQKN